MALEYYLKKPTANTYYYSQMALYGQTKAYLITFQRIISGLPFGSIFYHTDMAGDQSPIKATFAPRILPSLRPLQQHMIEDQKLVSTWTSRSFA
ncbi:hypothetical protein SNOG_03426 [Parastagonospora nodorum SN15]|uniref:Uncharacterized protein n=1 Tax=Phaeosphaeria nodorum (strain SN15 / ATCC MYA-4574 / FGSC 10173) TaxID=321614 RepID=Q0UXT8_PHANO|nr:hypothetical protein SNOG_03426 [Parastagonospora nodorum SN15]EAT88631.1 hypothetical protein SNOG_03426 [Parastagonospora nodorum SN15]